MQIGDKVRLLKGTEEGIIVGFKGRDIVEIEIEDGFVIPVLRKEAVVIDRRESKSFGQKEEPAEKMQTGERKGYLREGIYFGLKENDDETLTGYLINQTPDLVLYSIMERAKKHIEGKAFGVCQPFSYEETGILPSSVFNRSTRFILQVIIHKKESRNIDEPLHIELNFGREILKSTTFVEMMGFELALIDMTDYQPLEVDPEELKEKMLGSHDKPVKPEPTPRGTRELTIDLHVDPGKTNLNEDEILEHQLEKFEKAYDRALLTNASKLTIIHGVGSGILRTEIHKRLSRKDEIKYFEDAAKEKFGYGATTVYFK